MAAHDPALDEWFSLAYEELRRLASSVRRDNAIATLNPTALVHEAWLKLARTAGLDPTSKLHFKRIAARAMRQVLVDAARRKNTEKRGAGAALVTFDDALDEADATADDVLTLDDALAELAEVAPRQAAMVEARFFGGFDVQETAELLEVSEATVMRDWRAAKAWLALRVRGESSSAGTRKP